jgi:hypothetical protein
VRAASAGKLWLGRVRRTEEAACGRGRRKGRFALIELRRLG